MIIRKRLKFSHLVYYLYKPVIYCLIISISAFLAYDVLGYEKIGIPTIITGTMGTALAIFIGFRNSSAYDRWWEARKIWGGIVNHSRTYGRQVVTLLGMKNDENENTEIEDFKKQMVYRHIAWMNALRLQLRNQTTWDELKGLLDDKEYTTIIGASNKATQLVQNQAISNKTVFTKGYIDEFRHMQIDSTLTELYNLQGMAERIKNTPLPKQYDYFINVFLFVFMTLLPFSLVNTIAADTFSWLVIPISTIISLCFYVISATGAINEDPFENRFTDTPMTALCRTIEIDLREFLKETDTIPEKLTPVDGFLM